MVQKRIPNSNNLRITRSLECLKHIYPNIFAKKQDPIERIALLNELSIDKDSYHGLNDEEYLKIKKRHNTGKEFEYIEYLIAKTLLRNKDISNNYRHGSPDMRECDIVDEDEKKQIEVTTLGIYKVAKKYASDVDQKAFSGYNSKPKELTKSLIEKFDKKDYTDKYRKGICIFLFGNQSIAAEMAVLIQEHIISHAQQPSKNSFEFAYIIFYDIIAGLYFLYSVNEWIKNPKPKGTNILPSFVQRKEISIASINPEKWYEIKYYTTKNKLSKDILNGKDILTQLKNLSVQV